MAEAIIPIPFADPDRTIANCCINAKRLENFSFEGNEYFTHNAFLHTFKAQLQLGIIINLSDSHSRIQSQSMIIIYPGMTNYLLSVSILNSASMWKVNVSKSQITFAMTTSGSVAGLSGTIAILE